jgi:hypothetical protein
VRAKGRLIHVRRNRIRVAVVAAVIALVAVPFSARAMMGAATDDDVSSAVALRSSPTTGTVDQATDLDDVYRVDLTAGKWIYASLSGASGSDFDLYLFGPGTRSVSTTQAAVAYSETPKSSSERILYQVKTSGTHYLDVWAYGGTGSYSVTYGFPTAKPSVSATGPAICEWESSVPIAGTVTDAGGKAATGEKVYLYAKPYGASSYSKLAEVKTNTAGAYSFTVKPKSQTRYQVRHLGSSKFLPTTASVVTVTPRAYLTKPTAPGTVTKGVQFTSIGYLKPRHPAGGKNVKLTCYRREAGVWAARKTVYAVSANYSTYTKYTARFTLPYSGDWKIVASVSGDGQHAQTTSAARYRTVR